MKKVTANKVTAKIETYTPGRFLNNTSRAIKVIKDSAKYCYNNNITTCKVMFCGEYSLSRGMKFYQQIVDWEHSFVKKCGFFSFENYFETNGDLLTPEWNSFLAMNRFHVSICFHEVDYEMSSQHDSTRLWKLFQNYHTLSDRGVDTKIVSYLKFNDFSKSAEGLCNFVKKNRVKEFYFIPVYIEKYPLRFQRIEFSNFKYELYQILSRENKYNCVVRDFSDIESSFFYKKQRGNRESIKDFQNEKIITLNSFGRVHSNFPRFEKARDMISDLLSFAENVVTD